MNEEDGLSDPKRELRHRGKHIICIVIDAVYLCLWALVQCLVKHIVDRLELSGIDQWVLRTFQVIFAVSTLVPVIIYIYVDIRVMIIRAGRQLRREIQRN